MTDFELNKILQELKEELTNIKFNLELGIKHPNQIILDDVALQDLLHVSKRKTQQWRDEGLISYSKPSGKIFYFLSDVLEMLNKAKISSKESAINTFLQKKGFNKRKKH